MITSYYNLEAKKGTFKRVYFHSGMLYQKRYLNLCSISTEPHRALVVLAMMVILALGITNLLKSTLAKDTPTLTGIKERNFSKSITQITDLNGISGLLEFGTYHLGQDKIEVSAYNLGIESQNDSSPCVGAYGDNLCEIELPLGQIICASNYFKKGQVIHLTGFGDCVIMDRMNSRYQGLYIDIAFGREQIKEALAVGRQKVNYYIIK